MALRKKQSQDHFPLPLEYLILIAIVLVVIHTIVDDLARIYHWPHRQIVILAIIGFAFDLFFSLEFGARSFISWRAGNFRQYFWYERGWVDLLASVPLLLLVSGPAMILYLNPEMATEASTSFLHVLKSAKAIRVTRILRLIRILKIFGRIQNTDSVMANRHVASIATISVVSIVLCLVTVSVIPAFQYHDLGAHLKERKAALGALIKAGVSEEALIRTMRTSPHYQDVIHLSKNNNLLYESTSRHELRWTAYPRELDLEQGYTVSLSHYQVDAREARYNLFALFVILFLIGGLMFVYTGLFVREVADPVFIMDKGMRYFDYNLEVRVPDHCAQDEVFQLARAYNARWLPLKNQINDFRKRKSGGKSVLSVDDLL
ncbi:MAG: ion transporter [Spirochaetales bacterium]|nr:ion transporter [Spirochaetales bacterium]